MHTIYTCMPVFTHLCTHEYTCSQWAKPHTNTCRHSHALTHLLTVTHATCTHTLIWTHQHTFTDVLTVHTLTCMHIHKVCTHTYTPTRSHTCACMNTHPRTRVHELSSHREPVQLAAQKVKLIGSREDGCSHMAVSRRHCISIKGAELLRGTQVGGLSFAHLGPAQQ